MKFVHIADLHVGQTFESASFGGQFGTIKRQAIKENLRKVIEFCNQQTVDFLLMAGDCIEADYAQIGDWLDMRYLFEQLDKTRVIMIAGNHDPTTLTQKAVQSIQWPDNVKIVEKAYEQLRFEQEDVTFFCTSWQAKNGASFDYEYLKERLNATTTTNNIGIFHGDIYNGDGYMPLDRKWLLNSELDYIALGHIHKMDIIANKLAYPGSLEPLDFGETGNHGFIYGTLEATGLNLQAVTQMIHPMKIHELDISGLTSMMEILDAIKKAVERYQREDMLRLVLIGEMDEPFSLLKATVNDDWNLWIGSLISYLEVVDKTIGTLDLEQIYSEHKEDIIGYYIEALRQEGEKDVAYQQALELGVKMLLDEVK